MKLCITSALVLLKREDDDDDDDDDDGGGGAPAAAAAAAPAPPAPPAALTVGLVLGVVPVGVAAFDGGDGCEIGSDGARKRRREGEKERRREGEKERRREGAGASTSNEQRATGDERKRVPRHAPAPANPTAITSVRETALLPLSSGSGGRAREIERRCRWSPGWVWGGGVGERERERERERKRVK